MSRQIKISNRRQKTKGKISQAHLKVASIRLDFCHQTSRSIVNLSNAIIVFEDLRTKNLTRKPKPTIGPATGKWLKNKARAKAGLNKAIVNMGWHRLEAFTKCKSHRARKSFLKSLLITPVKSMRLAATLTPRTDKHRNSLSVGNVDTLTRLITMQQR